MSDAKTTMETLVSYNATPGNAETLSPAMVWEEGLALGAALFTADWAVNGGTSLTTSSGTTTASRAATNGAVTGLLTEAAYFYTTYTIDPIDLTRFIITNDGSATHIAEALFSVDSAYKGVYTAMGMSVATTDGCTQSTTGPASCDVAFDVVVAQAYATSSGIAECTTTVSYGGGDCDPDDLGKAVYEAINEMRTTMSAWQKYIDIDAASGNLITCSANLIVCPANYNGDADNVTTDRSYPTQKKTGIQAAAAAMTTAGTLSALEWVPGLYFAAKDQATTLATAETTTSVGSGDSTFAGRVAA